MPDPEQSNTPNNLADKDLEKLTGELKKESEDLNKTGRRLGIWALVSVVLLYGLNVLLTYSEGQTIRYMACHGCSVTDFTTFHLVSKFITGSFLAAIFYWIFRVCMSNFDQAVRYKKRYHSATFLRYLNHSSETTELKMKWYEIWIKTTDSAFSTSKKDEKKILSGMMDTFNELNALLKKIQTDGIRGNDPTKNT